MTNNQQPTTHKGFTLVEVLIAVALVGIAVAIVSISFSKINSNKALESNASLAASVLNEARGKTLSGEGAFQYGVYIGDGELVLFRGATYSPSDPNNVSTQLNSLLGVRNILISGGGRSVIFQKFTGATNQNGTFEIYLKSDATQYKTIRINSTGVVEEN